MDIGDEARVHWCVIVPLEHECSLYWYVTFPFKTCVCACACNCSPWNTLACAYLVVLVVYDQILSSYGHLQRITDIMDS